MEVEPKLSKTVSGQYQIVDGKSGDGKGDGAPLIKFYNEFNDIRIIKKIFQGMIDENK